MHTIRSGTFFTSCIEEGFDAIVVFVQPKAWIPKTLFVQVEKHFDPLDDLLCVECSMFELPFLDLGDLEPSIFNDDIPF